MFYLAGQKYKCLFNCPLFLVPIFTKGHLKFDLFSEIANKKHSKGQHEDG